MRRFGQFIKDLRIEKEISLRDFCRQVPIDPSNWSRIERGLSESPKSSELLDRICEVLSIPPKSDQYYTMRELAAIDAIPTELIPEENFLEKLPIFFRSVRGQKPTEQDLDNLLGLIKKNLSHD